MIKLHDNGDLMIKKTKEENINIIQQKVTVLEERLNEQRFPRDEEEIELEAGKN